MFNSVQNKITIYLCIYTFIHVLIPMIQSLNLFQSQFFVLIEQLSYYSN